MLFSKYDVGKYNTGWKFLFLLLCPYTTKVRDSTTEFFPMLYLWRQKQYWENKKNKKKIKRQKKTPKLNQNNTIVDNELEQFSNKGGKNKENDY